MSETPTSESPVAPSGQGGEVPDADARATAPDAAPDADGRRRRWWRGDKSVLIVTGIVALGFVLVLRGVLSGVTGDERAGLPPEIESLNPVPEAVQVLSQSSVFVDLAPNHTGVLIIDGVEIETVNVEEIGRIDVEPGQQIDLPPVTIFEPGNATLTFSPGTDAPIEEFAEGEHEVELLYWKVDETRQRARRYTWTFNVV